jgi:hypothetical protein
MGDQLEKKRIEKATLWALLGILATVILGAPAIYFSVHEKRPHISYEIIGDSKVLDVHQPVKELEIRYRGEDIYALNKNLSVLTITIRNDGETHIKQSDFDESMPWGLQIKKGQLVDIPKLVSFNSDYIRDNINLQTTTNNLITFQKLIFERDKYFTIELQLLHHSEDEPEIEVVGKIAGIETQTVINNIKDSGSVGFWAKVFYGPLTVQLVRVLVFVVATILLIVIVIYLIVSIGEALSSRKSLKTRREINAFLGPLLEGKDEKAQEGYKWLLSNSSGRIESLKELKAFLHDPNAMNFFLEGVRKNRFSEADFKKLPGILSRTVWQVKYTRQMDDGHTEDFFSVNPTLQDNFLANKLSGDQKNREEMLLVLDRLISHLETNEVPTKLKKLLSQR